MPSSSGIRAGRAFVEVGMRDGLSNRSACATIGACQSSLIICRRRPKSGKPARNFKRRGAIANSGSGPVSWTARCRFSRCLEHTRHRRNRPFSQAARRLTRPRSWRGGGLVRPFCGNFLTTGHDSAKCPHLGNKRFWWRTLFGSRVRRWEQLVPIPHADNVPLWDVFLIGST